MALLYTTIAGITQTQPDLIDIDPDQIEQAIQGAEAEINGHIARLYTLPITVPVPLLTSLANEIAIYRIFTSRPFQGAPRPVETQWVERYKTAVAILLQVAAGTMLLVDATGVLVTQSHDISGAWSSTMNYTPTFGEGQDQGFTVDVNKIEAESARRGRWR
jgi:phage gp36-like protein